MVMEEMALVQPITGSATELYPVPGSMTRISVTAFPSEMYVPLNPLPVQPVTPRQLANTDPPSITGVNVCPEPPAHAIVGGADAM